MRSNFLPVFSGRESEQSAGRHADWMGRQADGTLPDRHTGRHPIYVPGQGDAPGCATLLSRASDSEGGDTWHF
ncbi:MAG: hypothetical protein OXC07_11485 [Kistimonas sp.]|nr:hypothetical protein [Kistimonas sp.]